jgi:hypothetical protein
MSELVIRDIWTYPDVDEIFWDRLRAQVAREFAGDTDIEMIASMRRIALQAPDLYKKLQKLRWIGFDQIVWKDASDTLHLVLIMRTQVQQPRYPKPASQKVDGEWLGSWLPSPTG